LATLGNTAGGMTPGGAAASCRAGKDWRICRTSEKLERWGSPALLLSWLPLVGDALCLAAGWLRIALAAVLPVHGRRQIRALLVGGAGGAAQLNPWHPFPVYLPRVLRRNTLKSTF
jgi:hypothetical protein